jgi:hypothetical protein
MKFKLWIESKVIIVPFTDLIASHRGLMRAMNDIDRGRISKTQGPIHVWQTEKGPQLVDGYHRVFAYLLFGKKEVQAEIIGSGYTDYWASVRPDDLFEYLPNAPYQGLENLADEEILEEMKQKLT